ncbi:quinone oxidoreductase family protein [Streptomyces sp. ME19-01-6]|uniref:quinone oxidoreductase family protein n=1 Tax=Streptomyces sp. ME19-01-6 TaxID=3028686 RepID=UPI0029AEE795|nr:zinc-binding dehydrogenase [Streptomyces sp. ME19-01-6]MDX3227600.1 zinc-binding dehydrogenase [Streptomyces sp. ME19-01-6]
MAIYGHSDLAVAVDGLFQEWALVRDDRLLELSDTLDWAEGSALMVNYLTTYLALTKTAKVRSGQIVLVSGATGGVGHAGMQTAKALGARPVGRVSSPQKARRATETGAWAVIDSASQKLDEAIAHLTDGHGVDIARDPVGGPRLGELTRSVRPGGTVMSLGFTGGTQAPVDVLDLFAGRLVTGYGVHGDSDEEIAKGLRPSAVWPPTGSRGPSLTAGSPSTTSRAATSAWPRGKPWAPSSSNSEPLAEGAPEGTPT